MCDYLVFFNELVGDQILSLVFFLPFVEIL